MGDIFWSSSIGGTILDKFSKQKSGPLACYYEKIACQESWKVATISIWCKTGLDSSESSDFGYVLSLMDKALLAAVAAFLFKTL